MNPLSGFNRWFKQLAFGRVRGAKASTKGKLMGKQARAKGKVASTFNKGVDGAVKGAKNKTTGKGKGKKNKQDGGGAGKSGAAPRKQESRRQESREQEQKMGIFGRKKNKPPEHDESEVASSDEKTQMVDMGDVSAPVAECVGWVVMWNGPFKGRDFRLEPGKNEMGTDADCAVVLTDPYSSGKHCVIRFDAEEQSYTLIDLDSTNGTFVNNERVVKCRLVDNDKVRIGRTEMLFKGIY